MPEQGPPSDRVRVRRLPGRGRYDLAVIHEILDAGIMCHLGIVEDGQPIVIPTLYGREGDSVIVHGSGASRTLRHGARLPVCLTVTHMDGLVLARSLFNHTANYRSVVAMGQAVEVTDQDDKMAALQTITEHLIAGRWDEARLPNDREMRATRVLRLDLTESSAKIRSGQPSDDDADMALDVWAGHIPLSLVAGDAQPDPLLPAGVGVPASVRGWTPDADRLRRRPT